MPAGATSCAEHGEADFYHTPGILECENQTCECVEEPSFTHRRARPPHPLRRSVSLALTEMPGNNCDDFFGIELSMPLVKQPSLSAVPQRVACETLLKEPDAEPGTEATSSGDEMPPKRRRRSGPRHALTHGVQDGLMEELYRWYEERLEEGT